MLPPVLGGQAPHRLLFKHPAIVMNLANNCWRKNKETAINPATFAFGFFLKLADAGSIDVQAAKSGRRLHRGQSHRFAVLAVKSDGRGDIHVTYTIAVCHAECVFPSR